VLVRRSDGAVHQLVHGAKNDFRGGPDDHESKRFAPFYLKLDKRPYVDVGYPLGSPKCLDCNFVLKAEDRDGALWEHVCFEIDARLRGEFKTADDLAQALAMLKPWIV
jgi:hypothetical protein